MDSAPTTPPPRPVPTTITLLNALLAEAEAPPVRAEIVDGIGRVLDDDFSYVVGLGLTRISG